MQLIEALVTSPEEKEWNEMKQEHYKRVGYMLSP